ncbi:hypothetical protein Q9L58_008226 [Maublancomyces gigas]|uniref:Uncharacterized protein n=1 Tax=Discina gigas TaxID=1032678 RepID=A0ABR3GAA5_9PEZI
MSAGPSTPSPTAPNIARYTQAISSNLGNLMTEIGRANAPSNDAILHQLLIITEQLTLIVRRLDGLEKISSPQTDGVVPLELSANKLTLPTAAENNARARLHNATARLSSDALLPMHNTNNKTILGFPPTLGHLAHLGIYPSFSASPRLSSDMADFAVNGHLRKAFNLSGDVHALAAFCGVNIHRVSHVAMDRHLREDVILLRTDRRLARDAAIAAAGPATPATKRAAAIHNLDARARNRDVYYCIDKLVPIHDDRNLVVEGAFLAQDKTIINPLYLADVLYFLREYGQSTHDDGCVVRWLKFVGLDEDVVAIWDGEQTLEWFW